MTVIVLLGAPGAGKGTQAPLLAATTGYPHIATGDLFRAEARAGTRLGLAAKAYMDRGELVPDDVTIDLLLDRLDRSDARRGVILDGFPRTRIQAEALDAALVARGVSVGEALLIDMPEDELVRRLTGRWICEASGHVYHAVARPPKVPGVCDIDGSPLFQRSDDRLETVQTRLATQLGSLEDVVAHYRDRGLLTTVDGCRSADEVGADLVAAISQMTSDRA